MHRQTWLHVRLLTRAALVRLFTRAVLNGGWLSTSHRWLSTSRRSAECLNLYVESHCAGLRSASRCLAERLAPPGRAPHATLRSSSRRAAERLDPYDRATRAGLRSASIRMTEVVM